MQRNLKKFNGREFDVVIVGGGIYGAALVREAALSGLDAALLEKGDFCCATSANSLKIIHGGLRYLQQADIIRIRESVRERRAMLRIAPHLISPLPCLMPTAGLFKSKPAMFAALLANDILSADRNRGVPSDRVLGRGRVVSKVELCRAIGPPYSVAGNGAAIWYDAVADNTERIVVEMVKDAVAAGAVAANHATVTGLLRHDKKIIGVKVCDELSGSEFDVRAKLVINAAGPWSNKILAMTAGDVNPLKFDLALSMNAVLKRELIPEYAAGLPCQEPGPDRGRLMFIMPWHGVSIGGTFYRHFAQGADALKPTAQDVARLISQLNSALPGANITESDISRIHAGLLPCQAGRDPASDPKLLRHYSLIDHAQRDGIDGLLTVLGVKYTTARDVAARSIKLAARKLGKTIQLSQSDCRPLPGVANPPPQELENVVADAIENEMAESLSDLIYRRTDLGGKGAPPEDILQQSAAIMATQKGWDTARTAREIESVHDPLGSSIS